MGLNSAENSLNIGHVRLPHFACIYADVLKAVGPFLLVSANEVKLISHTGDRSTASNTLDDMQLAVDSIAPGKSQPAEVMPKTI